MEIEPRPSVVAKKLWNIVRIVLIMMRKGLSKSKLMVDFHLLLKRGKLAGKAMAENFILHHYSAFSCRSNDAVSFISPREYEFSCSNSPANFNPFHFNKRNKHHHHHHNNYNLSRSYNYDDVSSTVTAVQKVLEMYLSNNNSTNHGNYHLGGDQTVEASPLVMLPGFGKSPLVRQLRITDSPFPLKDEGGDNQVDVKAEDFINKFYKNLKLQKKMSYLESPYRS
ncbi:hypothetical protein L484_010894 [Morus notabilis]|uniref:Avr9/Cf-9 rapidly elicited protein 146 n=1 Tax=Morus notabilis TaxID=981085 RepID=W9RM18_9ROSA|nr:uncharacterized protein LOC21394177 [Morus notabilis]EXB59783.1 hypothetical protein L484_010894 [Morus notabilis]